MPSIAHLVLGTIVGLSLYYISDSKFSKTHVFILMMNNYYGPDAGYIVGLGTYTHTLVLWPVFALIMAIFYHYITKFSLQIDGIKKIELIELEEHKLTYINTYLLVLAGGIMHIYLDGILNWIGVLMIFPPLMGYEGFYPTLDDLFNLWAIGVIDPPVVFSILIGILLIFGFIYIVVYFLKKESILSGFLIGIYILIFMIFFNLVGNILTLFHPDAGAIIYVSIFWGAPLILCVLSTKNFEFFNREKKQRKLIISEEILLRILKITYLLMGVFMIFEGITLLIIREVIFSRLLDAQIFNSSNHAQFITCLNLISIFLIGQGIIEVLLWRYLLKLGKHIKNLLKVSLLLFFMGGILCSVSILGLSLNDVFVDYVFTIYPEIEVYLGPGELFSLAVAVEIILLTLSILYLIGAIGLAIQNERIWKFMIQTHLILGWTIIGLIIACSLSENVVKEGFQS
ncbi:MAG: hypothetical protein ACTSR8_08845 [Promethearchaeota archaeon]